jgi:hypothetical protein
MPEHPPATPAARRPPGTLIGHVDLVSHARIVGWAADRDQPEEQIVVRATVNGKPMRAIASLMREDLKSAFPNATGAYGFVLEGFPLPLSPFATHQVEVAFARGGAPLPGGTATLPAIGTQIPHGARAGKRVPIIVTTTGRTGSSLLMARLARHAGILVGGDHPHELKLLSYYAAALRTLAADADRERSTTPETMVALPSRYFIGHNPYNSPAERHDPDLAPFWRDQAPDMLRDCFAGLVDAYYDCLARKTEKPVAGFFAEKIGASDFVREATAFMFGPVIEIVLVRDPRDIICSSKSFWRRGFEDSVKALRSQFKSMSRPRAEAGLRQHVVRYEDLLLTPQQTMAALLGFLGLSGADLTFDDATEAAVFAQHATRDTPAETIGRWRREFSAEETVVAERELQPFIERYGYSVHR